MTLADEITDTAFQRRPNPLTTDDFLRLIQDAKPVTAVFDYDGTLWPGDAGSGFMAWSIRTGLLSPEKAEWLTERHCAYHCGLVDETTICGEMVQVYAGLSERAVRDSARAYFEAEVAPHLFPVMTHLVRGLKRSGTEIWAVSSTNNWVIEEGARALDISPNRVLAACIACNSGVLHEKLLDVPSGEGKAEALRRAGLPQPDAVFGNSIHDAAMLQIARYPFPVNPNAALQAYAAERGWPVYYPVSTAYPAAETSIATNSSV